jgi:hypothetical protein
MVTVDPTAPTFGVRLATLGADVTMKGTPVLGTPVVCTPFMVRLPASVTTTLPLVAPTGTVAVMAFALQFVMLAETPLNFTEL